MRIAAMQVEGGSLPRQTLLPTAFVGLLYIAGNLSNAIYPVFVSGALASGKVTASNVGVLATAEFLPFGLAIMFAGAFLRERRLRLIAGTCLLTQVLLGYLSSHLPFAALIPCRAAFGVASGVLLWIAYAYIARSLHAGRLVAIYTTILMSLGIALSWLEPNFVMPQFGYTGVLLMLIVPSVLAILLLPCGPDSLAPLPKDPMEEEGTVRPRIPPAALMLLASTGFWSAYMYIYWVYADPISMRFGEGIAQYWLTVSLACQVIGAGSASLLAERIPNRSTITLGLIAQIGLVAAILLGVGQVSFVIWNGIAGFFGYFLVSFFINALIQTDPTRRSIVYFPAAQNLAGSMGPIVVAQVVSETDLTMGLIIDLCAILMALAMFWLAMTAQSRTRSAAVAGTA
jgi:MFS family permease